ncbi:hypothetical protein [Haladaptatus sp. ZSTT2]|uniref:hypothetical protein n=1 Tax=Haladaptatus sp. ZSTT2 TaxID=3120515 RepID=UPI00300F58C3
MSSSLHQADRRDQDGLVNALANTAEYTGVVSPNRVAKALIRPAREIGSIEFLGLATGGLRAIYLLSETQSVIAVPLDAVEESRIREEAELVLSGVHSSADGIRMLGDEQFEWKYGKTK